MATFNDYFNSPRRSPRRPLRTLDRSPRRANGDVRNLWLPLSPVSPCPDEEVIKKRSARRASLPAKLTYDIVRGTGLEADLSILDESGGDFDYSMADCETPTLISRTQCFRKRLIMSKLDLDTDPDSITSTPSSIPLKHRKLIKSSSLGSLQSQLLTLSSCQLVNLIESLVEKQPELEQTVKEIMPMPDIDTYIEQLEHFQRNILKGLPTSRFDSMRDALCYRRVKIHIDGFKAVCITQGKQILDNEYYEATVEYCLRAWEQVGRLPNWDNPSHNKVKASCFRLLAAQCKKAIKLSDLSKAKYLHLKEKIENNIQVNDDIKPCIDLVDLKMQKAA